MIKAKFKLVLAAALSTTFLAAPILTQTASAAEANKYENRFLELRDKITNPDNGYYRTIKKDGKTYKIPYHSRETFLCEGPDYGHETTSETYSYYVWLEAMYGKFSGDWTEFNNAWDSLEKFIIPSHADQPTNDYYKPNDPADMANEYISTNKYPSEINDSWPVGQDDLADELESTYGTSDIYGMHWLLDTDNWYGFGAHGKNGAAGYNKKSKDPVLINTYQRGPKESAFKTVTHPSWEDAKTYGSDDKKSGYLSLFTKDYKNDYAHQWRYTIASDADARAIQATYWADKWAAEQGDNSVVKDGVDKSIKLGDYLRYSMYDKYFREVGIGSEGENQGTNKHYLLGWYYSWGGDTDVESWGSWAFRIGCSHNHFGYQNPMAAWVLSNEDVAENTSNFTPESANGQSDWAQSLDRQVELYQWLQSNEGAIAGGCTNSYTTDNGSYQDYPAGSSTFYGMVYDEAPVYLDPPSNNWFGMQVWSLQRLAEYYYETGDARAQSVLNKWAKWAISNTTFTSDSYKMPANLSWEGQPDTWTGTATDNENLHVKIDAYTDADIGVAGSYANTLFYISAANDKHGYSEEEVNLNGLTGSMAEVTKKAGENILDIMWNNYNDEYGIAKSEEINPAKYFDSEIYIPDGWTGKMPNGDVIKSGVKFIDIRSGYKNDPDYAKIKAAYDKGETTEMTYHRYWAQVDVALACGTHAILFQDPTGDVNDDGKVNISDYTLLRRYVNADGVGIKINTSNADINKDGEVDFLDLLALKAMI